MKAFDWLLNIPRRSLSKISISPTEEIPDELETYLNTGGVSISAYTKTEELFKIPSGSKIGLISSEPIQLHYFIDWILGYQKVSPFNVSFLFKDRTILDTSERKEYCAILGRSPILFGEKIQDAILYKTSNVKKEILMLMIERLYGPSLKEKSNPHNPFVDKNNIPIPIQLLNAREHLEIQSINAILQKTPLLVFDCTSDFMLEALKLGYLPPAELINDHKTILIILPNHEKLNFEELLGFKFDKKIEI